MGGVAGGGGGEIRVKGRGMIERPMDNKSKKIPLT